MKNNLQNPFGQTPVPSGSPASSRQVPAKLRVKSQRLGQSVFMKTALPSLLIFAAVSPMASAGTKTYDGGVGGTGTAIEVTTNWSPDGLPITSDEVLLDNSIITLPSVLTITGSGTGVTYGDLLVNSNTLTNLSILSGTTSRLITLSNGGGSTAAVAAGGAAGDILLLGTNVTGTVTIGNNAAASTGRVNLALGADGNFNVVNSTATANLTGVLSGAFNLTKTGAGTLTLSGVNTWGAAKTFTLSAGTLNLNSTTALGSATNTFKISGGTTIDNTSGAAITLGNNQPMTIDGDFTFTGGSGTTHDLNLGTGAKTLGTSVGTSRTITTSAGTLTIGGIIGNGATANSIIK
ncbi:MAG: hypothetical protein ABIT37_13260, partial [Luteolibacter sp.]